MPYITTADIVAAAPTIDISATTRPTSTQVDAMIVSEQSTLDSSLAGGGYITPITGEKSLPVVKKILTHKVLAGVLRAKAYGRANPRDIGADKADAVADALVTRILDPDDDFRLEDAPTSENQKGVSLEGADALEGALSVDYETPITRYTRF